MYYQSRTVTVVRYCQKYTKNTTKPYPTPVCKEYQFVSKNPLSRPQFNCVHCLGAFLAAMSSNSKRYSVAQRDSLTRSTRARSAAAARAAKRAASARADECKRRRLQGPCNVTMRDDGACPICARGGDDTGSSLQPAHDDWKSNVELHSMVWVIIYMHKYMHKG